MFRVGDGSESRVGLVGVFGMCEIQPKSQYKSGADFGRGRQAKTVEGVEEGR